MVSPPRAASCLLIVVSICVGTLAGIGHATAQSRTAPRAASICAPCHGLDGVGRSVETPNIAGQSSIYLRKQLMAFKKRERKHPQMRYVARELTDRELDALIVYYSLLPPP